MSTFTVKPGDLHPIMWLAPVVAGVRTRTIAPPCFAKTEAGLTFTWMESCAPTYPSQHWAF